MPTRRTVRVAETYKAELTRLLSRQKTLEDMLITVTHVNITPDLRQAFVYVSSLNKKLHDEEILASLNAIRKELQHDIAKRVVIKYTPKIAFRIDDAIERGDRVMDLLNDIDGPSDEKN
ncbi:MAG: 30S ribosome-binding factor RbfA [Verrucomicrobiota bacterium]